MLGGTDEPELGLLLAIGYPPRVCLNFIRFSSKNMPVVELVTGCERVREDEVVNANSTQVSISEQFLTSTK